MSEGDLGHEILSSLNEQQRQAVLKTEGPLLVAAGAGSGKTRVLTHRVASILTRQLAHPGEILCITFTNKAAAEMRQRIHDMLNEQARGIWVHTFHAFCARVLRSDIHHIGYDTAFTILDANDQLSVVKDLLKVANIDSKQHPPRGFRMRISSAKNMAISPQQMLEQSTGAQDALFARIYLQYEEKLRAQQQLDFDDLIGLALKLLEQVPEVGTRYAEQFRYVHVDEYQDTNPIQYRLLKCLTTVHRNFCVVGDLDQSIYRFRGADTRNMMLLRNDFPALTVIALEQNYRSTQTILQAANKLISHNPMREEKILWTENPVGEKIRLFEANDEWDEARYVAHVISEAHQTGTPYAHHAILYRTNAQVRVIEEMLLKAFIPYRVWGGMRFYDRREIKDLLGYLHMLVRPQDDHCFMRVVNVPRRGVGNVTMDRLRSTAAEKGISLWEALERYTGKSKGLQAFADVIHRLQEAATTMALPELIDKVLEDTGYRVWLEQQEKEKAEDRFAYLDEFRSLAANFAAQQTERPPQECLLAFLTEVALLTDVEPSGEEAVDAVQLMTLHSAKGLEFPHVFLVGLEEENIPHVRAVMEDPTEGLWEERRLIYVALTRAQETLRLSHARSRTQFAEIVRRKPSRFLRELPEELLQPESSPTAASLALAQSNLPDRTAANRSLAFVRGDRVSHASWGSGEVISVNAQEDSIVISFPDPIGERRLLLAYAPLTRESVQG